MSEHNYFHWDLTSVRSVLKHHVYLFLNLIVLCSRQDVKIQLLSILLINIWWPFVRPYSFYFHLNVWFLISFECVILNKTGFVRPEVTLCGWRDVRNLTACVLGHSLSFPQAFGLWPGAQRNIHQSNRSALESCVTWPGGREGHWRLHVLGSSCCSQRWLDFLGTCVRMPFVMIEVVAVAKTKLLLVCANSLPTVWMGGMWHVGSFWVLAAAGRIHHAVSYPLSRNQWLGVQLSEMRDEF